RVAEEGGQFLRIVRDLRRVHSHIAALAYPTLNDLHPEESSAEMDETGEEPIREIAKRQTRVAPAVAVRDRSTAIL
ncbi:hypothetical protein ACXYUI_26865, partial [Klebsiella pneumoniae]